MSICEPKKSQLFYTSAFSNGAVMVLFFFSMTVYVVGPMCLLALYALLAQKRYYHYVQICLCVCEIYGGWITFGMCEISLTITNLHTHA